MPARMLSGRHLVPQLRRAALWPAGGLLLSILLAGQRFVLAPGFDVCLAPLLYLLAFRWYGRPAALVIAAAVLLAATGPLATPLLTAIAIGHVLIVDRFYSDDRSFSTITVGYCVGIALVGGALVTTRSWSPSVEHAVLVVLRSIPCQIGLATCADIAVLFVARDPRTGGLAQRRMVSMIRSIDALVSAAIVAATLLFLFAELHRVPGQLVSFRQQVGAAAVWRDRTSTIHPGEIVALDVPGWPTPLPMAIAPGGSAAAAMPRLGCTHMDRDETASDRRTFAHWMRACIVEPLSRDRIAIVSPRSFVGQQLKGVILGLVPLGIFLVLAELSLLGFRRAIHRSIAVWDSALERFGRSEKIQATRIPFTESSALLERFGAINNAFLAAVEERERLSRGIDELRATIGLKLFGDVRIDPAGARLDFVKVNAQQGRREMSLAIYPADQAMMGKLAPQNDVMIEFRTGVGSSADWHLFIAHDYDPALGGWRFGCIVKLRAAKAFQTQMRHHARLMELGGMASALSHELRQPLFTIALAAENGRAALRTGDGARERTLDKFDRIVEQVERATSIVERTSGYARFERDENGEREPTDLVEAISNAVRFMRPLLVERDIALTLDAPEALPLRLLPRVGVEQIVVNALQNAADSIDAAREMHPVDDPGIGITVIDDHGTVRVVITDTGAGVAEAVGDSAFDAFSTTKPAGKGTGLGLFVCRQIMDEIGGSITLVDNVDGPGAALTLTFPPLPPSPSPRA
ncbi:sensor histidine kinase [Sphingomonas jinjuensis]|nr:ATP-binding protein [Sphingomonas jinjuensis]